MRLGPAPAFTTMLHDDEATSIARVTGIPVATVHAMTLRRFHNRAIILELDHRTVDVKKLWGRSNGSSCCPDCLDESGGRWQISWRLTWSFACLRHESLLVDQCPRCFRPLRAGPLRLGRKPRPGICDGQLPGASSLLCGLDLRTVRASRLATNDPILDAQRWISRLLGDEQVSDTQVRQHLTDVRTLAGRFITMRQSLEAHRDSRQQLHRPGLFAPAETGVVAFGVAKAIDVIARPHLADVARGLEPLLAHESSQRHLPSPSNIGKDWGPLSPRTTSALWMALDQRLRSIDRLRYRSCTQSPKSVGRVSTQRSDSVPQSIWASWAVRLQPGPGYDLPTLRRALSAMLLLPGESRRNLDEIAAELGPVTPRQVGHVISKLANDNERVLSAVCQLADYLDAGHSPIDYKRRRLAVDDRVLTPEQWQRICWEAESAPGRGRRARFAAHFLWMRLTGSEAALAPTSFSARSSGYFPAFNDFMWNLEPTLLALLDEHAARYLESIGINEPVVWEPSEDAVHSTLLPEPPRLSRGADLRLVLIQLASKPQPQAGSSKLASTVGKTSPEHQAHLVVAENEKLTPSQSVRQWILGLGDGEQITGRRSIRQIAEQTGASRSAVRRQMLQANIEVAPVGRRPQPVDHDWIVAEYVRKGRTLKEVAADMCMSPSNLARVCRRLGIPVRSPGGSRGSLKTLAPEATDPAWT